MVQEYSISGLYYNYKRVDDEKLKNYLQKIQVVSLTTKGIGSILGYYPMKAEFVEKMIEEPRGLSLTFDLTETEDKPIFGLKEYKTITFLVKSTSRFFLKPDIGEVFDQIPWQELLTNCMIKAICVNKGYETLPDTEGEHFLMTAKLLVDESYDFERFNQR